MFGPRARRPRHVSFWGGAEWPKPLADGPSKYETNAFGTDDFMRFCRLVGAQPYLAVNVRSGSPRDFMDWVEYCNSPAGSTTPADLRVAGGERAPFGVHYWGIGNESGGCGGTEANDRTNERRVARLRVSARVRHEARDRSGVMMVRS